MNYLDIFKITPGNIVPSGRSYPENATARVALDVRKADGSVIPGCEISKGDPLTVIDVSYSRQLALVQYPTPGGIKQGYATAKFIDYKNQGNYHNGSTPEPVINYDGSSLGSLDPYETATKLFEVNGLTQVVYNTDKGVNTKSGFVRYAGGSQNVVHVDIPYPNVTNAQMIQYGTSGKGRALRAYKMGNGRNSFIFNCAIHGWEDHWAADGIELTKIGNQLIEHFQSNSTGDFTLYVIPAANPDGLSEGWTNNGPGRCTIVGAVDGNRDFSVGFSAGGAPRNHSGSHPLSVPETKELADFISGIKANTSGETYLIDMHGWEGSMVGDSRIGKYFTGKLGLVQKGFGNPRGFLVQWTNSIGIVSSIMELPTTIYSHADVVNLNCAGKIIEGLTEIMGTTGGGSTSSNSNGHIRSGVQYVNVRQEPNTNCAILGKLYGDNLVQILAKVKPYGDSYNWYKIVFVKNGERLQAYVREDFVTVTGPIIDGNYDGKQIGWKNISGKWYYFNEDGTMRKNAWLTQSNGQTFYLGADGAKYTGTHSMGDETWIFNEDGILERKWKLINGSWHVYDKNGTMLTDWIEQWGSWYYFNTDGTMRKNAWLHQSNGQTFYLGPDGIKYVGKHTIGGVEYTFNSAGILEDIKKGWQTINGKKYYFDNNGNKVVDWKEIDGKWYYFNNDGTMRTNAWLTQSNGQTFYLGADGAKYTGTHSMGDETWIFNEDGILERKWKLINGSWHVYDKNGTMLTDWIEQWGSWYYFNTDGTMRKNAWLHQPNGQTFYLGPDGIKYVGKHTIGGVEYTFNSAGILLDSINDDLRIGSKGDAVKDLQSKLAYVGLPVSIDGVFGEETEKYVKEFQKAHKLYVDGIVGNQTMTKLDEEVKTFEDVHNATQPTIIPNQNEIYKNILNLFNFNFNKVLKTESKYISLGANISAVVSISLEASFKVLNGKNLPSININDGKIANIATGFPDSLNASINRDKIISVGKSLGNGIMYISISQDGSLLLKITGTYKTKDGTKSFSDSIVIKLTLLPDMKPGSVNTQEYTSWNQILNGVDLNPAPRAVTIVLVLVLGAMMLPGLIVISSFAGLILSTV